MVKKLGLVVILAAIGLFWARLSVAEEGVIRTGIYGEEGFVTIYQKDLQACDDQKLVGMRKCAAIEQQCVDEGGCGPRVASMVGFGCYECEAVAAPCFESLGPEYNQCVRSGAEAYEKANPKDGLVSTINFIPVDEIIPFDYDDKFAQSLIGVEPNEGDLGIDENAQRLNDELRDLFGDFEAGELPTASIVPEYTGTTPYVFDDPGSVDRRYYSFTTDEQNHIVEYRGGNDITLHLPNGTEFSPQVGDFVRIPAGTRISVDLHLEDLPDYQVNVFRGAQVGITNVAGLTLNASLNLSGGSEIEIVPVEYSDQRAVRTIEGMVRYGFGYEPELPPEIHFEGRRDVMITSDGTDFAVDYNRETGSIVAEIYDGAIKVKVGEKIYVLSSNYGGEVKRIEIEGSGEVRGRIALSQAEWEVRPMVAPVAEVDERRGSGWWAALAILVGVMAAGGLVGYWFRRRYGAWPLEARWKPILRRISFRFN